MTGGWKKYGPCRTDIKTSSPLLRAARAVSCSTVRWNGRDIYRSDIEGKAQKDILGIGRVQETEEISVGDDDGEKE